MDPNDSDWWWQIGLDGIAGGIVGGCVTGLAVWLTIRHERRHSEELDVRRQIATLHAFAVEASTRVPAADANQKEWMLWDMGLSQPLYLAIALAWRREEKLSDELMKAKEVLDVEKRMTDRGRERQRSIVLADRIAGTCWGWLAHPHMFNKEPGPDWPDVEFYCQQVDPQDERIQGKVDPIA